MSLVLPHVGTAGEESFSWPYVDANGSVVAWRLISLDDTTKKSDVFILPDGTPQATAPAGSGPSADIGGSARTETVYVWQQFALSFTASLVAATRTVTITDITINGTAAQAGEVSWGDGVIEFFPGGTPSHQYPEESRTWMISVLGLMPFAAIEQSVLIENNLEVDQTVPGSSQRLMEYPITRVTTADGAQFYFSPATGQPVSMPLASIAHSHPLQTKRERHVMMIGETFLAGGALERKLYRGFAQAAIRNKVGDLFIDNVSIPANTVFELPPMGDTFEYGDVTLRYAAAGEADIWIWRKSL